MSRLHEALQRSRGTADGSGQAAGAEPRGLEVYSERDARVVAPWALDDRRSEPEATRPAEAPAPAAPPALPAPRRPAISGRLLAFLLAAAGAGALLAGVGFTTVPSQQRLTGVVVANRVVVSANAGGRIRRLSVEEGAVVARGDTLALLDREEMDAERERQVGLVEELSARLRQAREIAALEGERGRGGVAAAEAGLRMVRSQRDEAAAGSDQLGKDAERLRGLFDEGLVPYQQVERIETDVRAAAARVRSLGDQVEQAEAELELARANERQASVARRDVEQTEARLAQARAQLAHADARLSETEVRAPLGGVVSVRVAREGEVIRAGDPILTIVDLDDIWVRAELEESDLGRIGLGQVLEVELASGARLSGSVTAIEPEAQFATQRDVSRVKRDVRTFGIKVTLPNAERRVHHGMTAYVLLPKAAE